MFFSVRQSNSVHFALRGRVARSNLPYPTRQLKSPRPQIRTVYPALPAALACLVTDGKDFIASLINRDHDQDGQLTPLDGEALFRFDLVDTAYVFKPISLVMPVNLSLVGRTMVSSISPVIARPSGFFGVFCGRPDFRINQR